MPRVKISKAAKDFNLGLPTVIEFLSKKGIEIEDNPNARIDEDVYNILLKEFAPDRELKTKSEKQITERQKEKAKAAPKPEEVAKPAAKTPEAPAASGVKVLGHIDLDKKGNPITRPAKVEEVKPEPVKEEVVEVKPAEKTPAPEPAEAAQPVKAPEVKAPEVKPEPQAAPKPEPKAEKPREAEPATAPVAKPAPEVAEKPQPKKAEEPEVFTVGTPKAAPTINVVGKIDLSALNQSTRPKKKTKEERRNERIAAAKENGDRKKRKRIGGKEKVDIEKAGANTQNGGGNDRGGNRGGGNNRGGEGRGRGGEGRGNRGKRPVHTEVNEEDVQKQIKETLARLTSKDKGQKKGAKWRKEKREAIANREPRQQHRQQPRARCSSSPSL